TPAQLELECDLSPVENPDDPWVHTGSSFSLTAGLTNVGEASVSDGQYRFSTHGHDLGIDSVQTGILIAGESVEFDMTAPDTDLLALITFTVSPIPIDDNSGNPAQFDDTAWASNLFISSIAEQSDLVVSATMVPGNLVAVGDQSDILTLSMSNRGSATQSAISVDSIDVSFSSSVSSILDAGLSGFTVNGLLVSSSKVISDTILRVALEPYILEPLATVDLTLLIKIRETAPKGFAVTVVPDGIYATILEGPLAGLEASANSGNGGILEPQKVRVQSAGIETFEIRDNPFDLNLSSAEFRYRLDQSGTLEFRVLTLTGEEVFTQIFASGDFETQPGITHVINWDGRNGDGEMVLNGVYMVMLRQVESGQQRILKVAVTK
ncbi:MAG: hypothetical protein V3T31_11345, partial [candidate division Zixibacteria bacterium]